MRMPMFTHTHAHVDILQCGARQAKPKQSHPCTHCQARVCMCVCAVGSRSARMAHSHTSVGASWQCPGWIKPLQSGKRAVEVRRVGFWEQKLHRTYIYSSSYKLDVTNMCMDVCVCCACECVLCGVVPVVGLPSSFFSAAGMLGLRVCARACAVWGSAQPGASPFLLQPRQGDLAVPTSSLQWIAHS